MGAQGVAGGGAQRQLGQGGSEDGEAEEEEEDEADDEEEELLVAQARFAVFFRSTQPRYSVACSKMASYGITVTVAGTASARLQCVAEMGFA